MKLPEANCPRCNSPQKFFPRERTNGDMIEKYIRCNMCTLETVLDSYPAAQRVSRKKSIVLRNRKIRRNRADDC